MLAGLGLAKVESARYLNRWWGRQDSNLRSHEAADLQLPWVIKISHSKCRDWAANRALLPKDSTTLTSNELPPLGSMGLTLTPGRVRHFLTQD